MKRKIVALVLLSVAVACGGEERAPEEPFPFTQGSEEPLPPTDGQTTFELLVIGDFGTGLEAEHNIADAMLDWHREFGVDAFLTTGDNIYPDGSPENFEKAWTEPFGWVEEENLRMVASLGNHDVAYENGSAVMELLEMPARYYEVSVGDADIFVLDGNDASDPAQRKWLNRSLRASKGAWQIAVMHQPPFSCSRHGSTPEVIEQWVPLFQKHGVDLVLAGHDHLYQRFEGDNGTTYVVTGGGGTFLDGEGTCPASVPERSAAVGETHHFVAIEGSAQELSARAVGLRDPILDEFTVSPTP